MKDTLFLPEGCLWDSPENKRYLASTKMLERAMGRDGYWKLLRYFATERRWSSRWICRELWG